MKTWQTIVLALAPACAVSTLGVIEHRHSQAQLDRLGAALAAVTASIEARSRENGEPARPAHTSGALPAQGALGQARPEPEDAPADDAGPGDAPERPRPMTEEDVRDRLEVSFLGEQADPRWSGEARRTAQAKLSAALPGASLRSVECRSAMCRIETTHADRQGYQEFVKSSLLEPQTRLWNGGFFSMITQESDGEVAVVTYLAREGEDLPPVPVQE